MTIPAIGPGTDFWASQNCLPPQAQNWTPMEDCTDLSRFVGEVGVGEVLIVGNGLLLIEAAELSLQDDRCLSQGALTGCGSWISRRHRIARIMDRSTCELKMSNGRANLSNKRSYLMNDRQ
jgi:hypothetical protein